MLFFGHYSVGLFGFRFASWIVQWVFQVKHICHCLSKNISLNIYDQTDRIKKVYSDPSGCVSIQNKNTLSGAKQNDSTVKLDDVKYVLPSM